MYKVKLDCNKYNVKELVYLNREIIKRDFKAEGNIDILIKDSGIVVNTAMALGIPLPVSTTANHILKMAQSRGLGQLHPAALIKLYEEFSQVEGHD